MVSPKDPEQTKKYLSHVASIGNNYGWCSDLLCFHWLEEQEACDRIHLVDKKRINTLISFTSASTNLCLNVDVFIQEKWDNDCLKTPDRF